MKLYITSLTQEAYMTEWIPIKCYPRDFASKKEEFEYYLPMQTTVHLERLLKLFPTHRSRKEIQAELERRKDAS